MIRANSESIQWTGCARATANRTAGLATDDDGSVTIYIQRDAPGDGGAPSAKPKISAQLIAGTACALTATDGVSNTGWIRVRIRGSIRIRPSEKPTRVVATLLAFEPAIAELTSASRDDDEPEPPDLVRHPGPRVAGVEGREIDHVRRAEADRRGVVAEQVERADPEAGPQDRPRHDPLGVAGLLAERRGGLEADDPEHRVQDARRDQRRRSPRPAPRSRSASPGAQLTMSEV